MEISIELTVLLVAVIAVINVFASAAVLRVAVFSPTQRVLQLALIWLVPMIGAVVCAAFASSQALGPTSRTIDPLYLPSDGGGPDGPSMCGCSGGDAGGDSGGGSD